MGRVSILMFLLLVLAGAPVRAQTPSTSTSGQEPSGDKKLTKEQVEKLKASRDKAEAENKIITQINTAIASKDWEKAKAGFDQLIEYDPTKWEFYYGLGNAQLNLGKYADAVASLQKGVHAAEENKDPLINSAKLNAGIAQMLISEGNAYLKLKKNQEASGAFRKAAELDPHPATAYFNLCATLYNAEDLEGAVKACDKAIEVDPNKADAYFIKGSALMGDAKTDSQGKPLVPPQAVEALKKYLALAPQGAHAADAKAMLDYLAAK